VNALKDVIRQPYAWPGGYEKVLVTDDGGLLCHKCAKAEYSNILHSTRGDYRDGWQITGAFCMADFDGSTECSHCNGIIG
jgi:hypothetical protein